MAISPAVQNPGTSVASASITSALHGNLIRSFLYGLAKNLYSRPANDPMPEFKAWSWKHPYSWSSREINPITADTITDRITVIKSFWGTIEAFVVATQPQANSCKNVITVYVLRDYITVVPVTVDHKYFSFFSVTKSLPPDEHKFLRRYFSSISK